VVYNYGGSGAFYFHFSYFQYFIYKVYKYYINSHIHEHAQVSIDRKLILPALPNDQFSFLPTTFLFKKKRSKNRYIFIMLYCMLSNLIYYESRLSRIRNKRRKGYWWGVELYAHLLFLFIYYTCDLGYELFRKQKTIKICTRRGVA
jgi:hypothetical protein